MDKLITRSTALKLHTKMWSDMREALGDCPDWKNVFGTR